LVAFNVYKQHASNLTVQILAYVKFVPLFAAIILGIVFLGNGGADSVNNLFTKFTENGQTKNDVATVISGVDLFALCVSLPPIFFATDGFTVTGSISTRIKNGQRNAPLAITIGMCIIIFIYIAITVAQIFTGAGSISALIPVVINNDVGAYLGIIVWCFIAFSAFATANGMLMSGISQAHDAIKGNYVVYSEKLLQKTKGKDLAAGGIAISVIGFIFALAFFIPAIFVESDAFMDVGTSIPSLVAFLLYGIVIFGALLNRYTKKVAVQRSKFLLPCGILAVIGIAFSVAFTFFYDNLYTAFIEKPFEINTSVGGFNYGYNMINYLTKGILT
jgi:amino acid transporter